LYRSLVPIKKNSVKVYDSAIQESQKFATFLEADKFISAHNARYLLGLETFDVAHNFLSDLSTEEYSVMSGFIPEELGRSAYGNSCEKAPSLGSISNPSSVDWGLQGYTTPVKDQGTCGSCWAFAATGALEGAHFKNSGNLVSLSEQFLVECYHKGRGCLGGNPMTSFSNIMDAGGIVSSASYPYT